MTDFEDDEMEFWLQVRPDDPRDRIYEIIQSLQKLLASPNETDKASMVAEAIEHIKALQQQVEVQQCHTT
jgi:hypothetical protein